MAKKTTINKPPEAGLGYDPKKVYPLEVFNVVKHLNHYEVTLLKHEFPNKQQTIKEWEAQLKELLAKPSK